MIFRNPTFRNTNFRNPTFRNTNFGNPNFGNTNFRNPTFRNTNFGNPNFGNTTFWNTNFRNTNFRNTTFRNWERLSETDLWGRGSFLIESFKRPYYEFSKLQVMIFLGGRGYQYRLKPPFIFISTSKLCCTFIYSQITPTVQCLIDEGVVGEPKKIGVSGIPQKQIGVTNWFQKSIVIILKVI